LAPEATDRDSFDSSWPLSEPRFGTHSDFPNSFGREILRRSLLSVGFRFETSRAQGFLGHGDIARLRDYIASFSLWALVPGI
jgi:hypothetical protein